MTSELYRAVSLHDPACYDFEFLCYFSWLSVYLSPSLLSCVLSLPIGACP